MEDEELEAIRQAFPFLEEYETTHVSVVESPGDLEAWVVKIQCSNGSDGTKRGCSLPRELRLLDKEGKTIIQVGRRQKKYPPLKILGWTSGDRIKDELFTETVAEALQRTSKQVYYILERRPNQTSFTLYRPPAGKTIEEWAREKDRRAVIEKQRVAEEKKTEAVRAAQEKELKLSEAREKLSAKLREIDKKANMNVEA